MRDAHDPFDAWHAPLKRLTVDSAAMRPWLVGITRETMEHRDYFHEVARADRVIGEFVDLLAQQQLLDNTIVIVISDNGPVQRAKTTLYERGLLTPLIVRYPPVTNRLRGERIHSLVSSIDLAPTIFQLVGVAIPTTVQGVPIPQLSDGGNERQWLYAERHNHGGKAYERALRTDTHLYKRNFINQPVCSPLPYAIKSIAPKTETYGAEELYDLASDPLQRNNLLHDEKQAEVLASLRATMNQQLRLLNDKGPPLQFIRCEKYRLISLQDAYRDV